MPSLSVPTNASASTPSRAPASLALGGSGHADAINSYPTRTACCTDLRDHAVRLMKWRGRHGLHGCCQGQGKSNSDQSDHTFLLCEPLKTLPAQSRLFANPFRVMKKIVKGRTQLTKKGTSDQFALDRTPKALFARVPGGKYRHISGHILRLDGGY